MAPGGHSSPVGSSHRTEPAVLAPNHATVPVRDTENAAQKLKLSTSSATTVGLPASCRRVWSNGCANRRRSSMNRSRPTPVEAVGTYAAVNPVARSRVGSCSPGSTPNAPT